MRYWWSLYRIVRGIPDKKECEVFDMQAPRRMRSQNKAACARQMWDNDSVY
jgi:hypothetical protein